MPQRNPRHEVGDLSFSPEERRALEQGDTPLLMDAPAPPLPTSRENNLPARHRISLPMACAIGGASVLSAGLFFYLGSLLPTKPPAQLTTSPSAPARAVIRCESSILHTRRRVNLRTEPTRDSAVLTSLAPGTRVQITSFTPSGWVEVTTHAGAGFVFGSFVGGCPALPFRATREQGEPVVIYEGRTLRP